MTGNKLATPSRKLVNKRIMPRLRTRRLGVRLPPGVPFIYSGNPAKIKTFLREGLFFGRLIFYHSIPKYTTIWVFYGQQNGQQGQQMAKPTKVNVRGKDRWVINIRKSSKRYRKFFDSYAEAKMFDEHEWIAGKSKKEPAGDKTILSVAFDQYILAYGKRNDNDHKPRQKGKATTSDRVMKFIKWFGQDRLVSEVTSEDYIEYVNSGNWSHKTKLGYGGAVKIFMAWCGSKGYGQIKEQWYSTVNKGLQIEATKKEFAKLPGICSIEETKGILGAIHEKYRPALAVMFFTGIRAEIEMEMLRYSDIQWGKRIGLMAERTKTGRERWIIPPENLWSWLPKNGKGMVNPVTYNALSQARALAAKRAFGWENNGRRGGGGVKGFNYPANGARHSFGSYGYWRDFAWALDTMGHMSSEVFLSNYKNNRVGKEESDEFFNIKM